jgi:hypothetical protein
LLFILSQENSVALADQRPCALQELSRKEMGGEFEIGVYREAVKPAESICQGVYCMRIHKLCVVQRTPSSCILLLFFLVSRKNSGRFSLKVSKLDPALMGHAGFFTGLNSACSEYKDLHQQHII